jgi:hypothetical protein
MEAMVFSLLKENGSFAVIVSGAKQSISLLAETWIASLPSQ